MGKYIGLLDCNNFFVSCERLFRPDLLSRPVLVLSSNDGCVVARSQEVKALGIPMGAPYFKIKDICKENDVVTFSTNFTLYRDISARVMRVLREVASEVEQYSVDESFFALTGDSIVALEAAALAVKQEIERQVGVPVSVGVAKSKTIAKYASVKEKREIGYCVLVGETWLREQGSIPLGEVWGIGGQTERKLREHELLTVADFLAAGRGSVTKLCGVVGARIYDELSEQAVFHLGDEHAAQQSIMSTRSFKSVTHSRFVLADALAYHVSEVASELRYMGVTAGKLQIIAAPSRHSDWALRQGGAEVILTVPSADTTTLLKEALRLLDTFFDTEVPYKKAGIVVSRLRTLGSSQLGLFEEAAPEDTTLSKAVDSLVSKFGRAAVRVGYFDAARSWQSKQEQISPHYTTKWSQIPNIKA